MIANRIAPRSGAAATRWHRAAISNERLAASIDPVSSGSRRTKPLAGLGGSRLENFSPPLAKRAQRPKYGGEGRMSAGRSPALPTAAGLPLVVGSEPAARGFEKISYFWSQREESPRAEEPRAAGAG